MREKKVFTGLAVSGVLLTSVLVVRVAWSLGSPADLLPFGIEHRAPFAPSEI
jgi:hypothetical protein